MVVPFLHQFASPLASKINIFLIFDLSMPFHMSFFDLGAKLVPEWLPKRGPLASRDAPGTPPRRRLDFK
jgi:hypothetical protein